MASLGTVLNDQFGGENGWETYLPELETTSPKIRSIAVTDYYVTDTYERVLQHKAEPLRQTRSGSVHTGQDDMPLSV